MEEYVAVLEDKIRELTLRIVYLEKEMENIKYAEDKDYAFLEHRLEMLEKKTEGM